MFPKIVVRSKKMLHSRVGPILKGIKFSLFKKINLTFKKIRILGMIILKCFFSFFRSNLPKKTKKKSFLHSEQSCRRPFLSNFSGFEASLHI